MKSGHRERARLAPGAATKQTQGTAGELVAGGEAICLDQTTLDRLDTIAQVRGCSRGALIAEAVAAFAETEVWALVAIRSAIDDQVLR